MSPIEPAMRMGLPSEFQTAWPRERLILLHGEVQRILRTAIESDGTTIRDYVTGTGQAGSFQMQILVYGRAGEPCVTCGTALAETHEIDARSTVFCWRCQR